jgi:translation elongation factor EF-1beta
MLYRDGLSITRNEYTAPHNKPQESDNETRSKSDLPTTSRTHEINITPLGADIDTGLMYIAVTSLKIDGVTWGDSKRVPMSHGLTMLKINCTINNPDLEAEDVMEEIESLDDLVNIAYLDETEEEEETRLSRAYDG